MHIFYLILCSPPFFLPRGPGKVGGQGNVSFYVTVPTASTQRLPFSLPLPLVVTSGPHTAVKKPGPCSKNLRIEMYPCSHCIVIHILIPLSMGSSFHSLP